MTIQEAEEVKQKLEKVLKETTNDGLNGIEIFIAPAKGHDFQSFRKMWRNSTYVVALATFGYADMNVYICDENLSNNKEDFETLEEYLQRTKISI